jgi:uncharacterized short protein YbdD (DUF466 family)
MLGREMRDAGHLSRAAARDGSALLAAIKRIVGMPNYEAYLEHLRTHHPECQLPNEREYFDDYLKGRYGSGFSRCC